MSVVASPHWDCRMSPSIPPATPAGDARSVIKFLSIGEELVRTPHYRLSSLAASGEVSDPDPRLHAVLDWLDQYLK